MTASRTSSVPTPARPGSALPVSFESRNFFKTLRAGVTAIERQNGTVSP